MMCSSGIIVRHGFTPLNGFSFEGYRNYLAQDTLAFEAEFISQRLESNRLTGGDGFARETESGTGIRLGFRRPDRPSMNEFID